MPKWNEVSERKLLLCIITFADLKTTSWEKISEMMGKEVTAQACRQHFRKLKQASAVMHGAPMTSEVKDPASTPASGKATKSGGKRKKVAEPEACVDDEEPDHITAGSPLPKKSKRENDGASQARKFKIENEFGDGNADEILDSFYDP